MATGYTFQGRIVRPALVLFRTRSWHDYGARSGGGTGPPPPPESGEEPSLL
jgi:hypothetical protein